MYVHFGRSGSPKIEKTLNSDSSSCDVPDQLIRESNTPAIVSSTTSPGCSGQDPENGANVIASPHQGDYSNVGPQNGVGTEVLDSEGPGVVTTHQHMANSKSKKKKKKTAERLAKIKSSTAGVSEADTVAAESLDQTDASSTGTISNDASPSPSPPPLSVSSSLHSLDQLAISTSAISESNDNGGGSCEVATVPDESVQEKVSAASDSGESSSATSTPLMNRKPPVNGSASAPLLKSKKLKKSLSRTLSNLDFDKCAPEICVALMHRPSIQNVGALKRKLKSCDTEWLQSFVTKGGLGNLLDYSSGERHLHQLSDALLLLECISCIRVVMNSRQGLEYIINTHYTVKLIKTLDSPNVMVKSEVFELLSVLCIYSNDGYQSTLDAIDLIKVGQHERYRFSFIVNELKTTEVIAYKRNLMAFINCILFATDELYERSKIREEFTDLNIAAVLKELRKLKDDKLTIQCETFEQDKRHDDAVRALAQNFNRGELNRHQDMFLEICQNVLGTPHADSFLNILQSLKQIDSEHEVSDHQWTIMEAISQNLPYLDKSLFLEKLLVDIETEVELQRYRNENHYHSEAARSIDTLNTSITTADSTYGSDPDETLSIDHRLSSGQFASDTKHPNSKLLRNGSLPEFDRDRLPRMSSIEMKRSRRRMDHFKRSSRRHSLSSGMSPASEETSGLKSPSREEWELCSVSSVESGSTSLSAGDSTSLRQDDINNDNDNNSNGNRNVEANQVPQSGDHRHNPSMTANSTVGSANEASVAAEHPQKLKYIQPTPKEMPNDAQIPNLIIQSTLIGSLPVMNRKRQTSSQEETENKDGHSNLSSPQKPGAGPLETHDTQTVPVRSAHKGPCVKDELTNDFSPPHPSPSPPSSLPLSNFDDNKKTQESPCNGTNKTPSSTPPSLISHPQSNSQNDKEKHVPPSSDQSCPPQSLPHPSPTDKSDPPTIPKPPPPPPLPPMVGGPPPPPPLPPMVGGPPPPPPLPPMVGGPPPPPPLPPMVGGPPPPPPLPGMGGPPPPPPPPFGHNIIPQTQSVLRAGTKKPKHKLRSFQWTKVPSNQLKQKNVWQEIRNIKSDRLHVDYDLLENMFSVKTVPKASEQRKKLEVTPKKVSLLNRQRSLDIAIFLRQSKGSHETTINNIRDANIEAFGLEKLRQMQKILPTDDEISMLNSHQEDRENLADPEKFCLLLSKLPSHRLQIGGMLLMEEKRALMQTLKPNIDLLKKTCQGLMENKDLKDFLALTLQVGNFMNSDRHAGNAMGFEISSAIKILKETKGNESGINLLHFLVSQAEESNSLGFVEQLESMVQSASRLSAQSLQEELSNFANSVSNLNSELKGDESLKNRYGGFIKDTRDEVDELQKQLKEIEVMTQKVRDYFCEKEKEFKLEIFLQNFNNFLQNTKDCQKENKQRLVKQDLMIRRQKKKEQKVIMAKKKEQQQYTIKDGKKYRKRCTNDEVNILDSLVNMISNGFVDDGLNT